MVVQQFHKNEIVDLKGLLFYMERLRNQMIAEQKGHSKALSLGTKSVLSMPFSSFSVNTRSSAKYSGSILSGQTLVNGISKTTLKALCKELIDRKAQLKALLKDGLSQELTLSEVLYYLKQTGFQCPEDQLKSLLKVVDPE
jgi:hypothetical protein